MKDKSSLKAFQLKGSILTITVLELLKPDTSAIHAQFSSLIKQTPDLFRRMPIIIDLNKIQDASTSIDFEKIQSVLKDHGLIPVGIRGGSSEQQAAATDVGLATLNSAKGEKKETPSKNTAPTDKSSDFPIAKIVNQPVRSGQQIYAKGGDLIILSSVSPGAEVLSDGNIHIYGTLRGRALAGISGNTDARIFCQSLDAELVSIAGHYWVNDDLSPIPNGQTIQIYLNEERLHISTF